MAIRRPASILPHARQCRYAGGSPTYWRAMANRTSMRACPSREPSAPAVIFSLMLCAMLRQHAIPARVRCGFARYFDPPSYEDHWICEYWKAGDQRWAMADAQLDDPHRAHLSIEFDTTDLPADQFVPSWRAWRRCRADSDHAALFGHGDHSGEWFVRVNLARDWLSLCKREVSAWDTWRDAGEQHRQSDGGAAAQCDRLAALCEAAIGLAPPGLADARLDTYLSAPPWLIGP